MLVMELGCFPAQAADADLHWSSWQYLPNLIAYAVNVAVNHAGY